MQDPEGLSRRWVKPTAKRWRFLGAWVVMTLLGLAWTHAQAASGDALTILQFQHTAWTDSTGGPKVVYSLAQTDDGYLWIGSAGGLLRFDGITFETVRNLGGHALSDETVFSVVARPGGELWIGYEAGIGHYKNGRYERLEPLRSIGGRFLEVDLDGVVWSISGGRLYRLEAGAMEQIGANWGYPEREAYQLKLGPDGTIWTAGIGLHGVYFLRRGERRFRRIEGGFSPAHITLAPNGDLWGTSTLGMWALPMTNGVAGEAKRISDTAGLRLLFDREGALWCVDRQREGLIRITDPGKAIKTGGQSIAEDEPFRIVDGLSSTAVRVLMEDREGNIWVGTNNGLERFRRSRMTPVRLKQPKPSVGSVLAPGKDGVIWAGDWANGLFEIRRGSIRSVPDVAPFVNALSLDAEGILWVGTADGHAYRSDEAGRFSKVQFPQVPDDTNPRIDAIASDAKGVLWLGGQLGPVRRLTGAHLDLLAGKDGFPLKWKSQTLMVDSARRTWIGNDSGIVLVTDGDARIFGPEDGVKVGRITSFHERNGHIWVAGSNGVVMFDGQRFRALTVADGTPLARISGVVEDSHGGLWLHTLTGAMHVSRPQLEGFITGRTSKVNLERFDALDGLYGSAPENNPKPNLVEASDGKIWFARSAGLSWIDPLDIRRNLRSPQSFVSQLTADGRGVEPTPSTVLPALTKNLEIVFTATALTVPERTRFRYKLDGADAEWVDAGSRRSAFYGQLAPGEYRFRLLAANEDDVWQQEERVVRFTMPPAWFQTIWFKLLCFLAGLVLVWLAYRLRVRQIEARLRIETNAEQKERERIARELHDTLLQSTQGLIFRIQAVANRMPADDPARDMIDDVLIRADSTMAEGRDRVLDLRVSADPSGGLADAIAAAGQQLAQSDSASIRTVVEGTPRALREGVNDEAFRIAREALLNAFRHAHAASIEIQIIYTDEELRLLVRDDGIGIDGTVLDAGSRPNHWGLQGMRERAGRIGASVEIWSRPGAGTEVELRIPAALAYAHRSGRLGWRRVLRWNAVVSGQTGQ